MDIKLIERIEAYLQGDMTSEEVKTFEDQISFDSELREQLMLYKEIEFSMRQINSIQEKDLNETLSNLNKKYIKEVHLEVQKEDTEPKAIPRDKPNYFRLFSALAAIFIMILAAYFLLFRAADPQGLAEKYYAENLVELSQTMGSTEDLIQLGIAAYNQKDYQRAQVYFQEALVQDNKNSDAIKYSGLAYLSEKEYDNAIAAFQELASLPDLFSNPGLFYQAFTLMMRNESGDLERAKLILERVVDQNEEGSRQAQEWLGKL
ncbi:MAG: tetratricopeptide repeat protein [Mongoliibacter sp.]|uniref:tetratricopeptide repeat protein n=1 Tax=Mongoliibacter sp. TaxID=2022438 RepID=UPI0012EF2938|nr:tetratricopeptide repeat protein [Mongoliibacter sp.]TVP52814.1 MAG: tetratricopeptide repeat protein [Mongoliibacter sp.]